MRRRLASGVAVMFGIGCAALACAQLIGADEVSYQASGGDASVTDGSTAGAGGSSGASGSGGASGGGTAGTGGSAQGGNGGQGGVQDAGSCDGGLVWCGGDCVDTSKSADHCGACGKDCGAAVCTDGVCQPEKLSGTLNHAPLFIDADSAGIYWASESACGSMELTGVGGKVIKDLAPGTIRAMVAGPNDLFLIVHYATDAGGTDRRIVRVPKDGGAVVELLTKLSGPLGLALTSKYLYWTSNTPLEGVSRIDLTTWAPAQYGSYTFLVAPSSFDDIMCFGNGSTRVECINPNTDTTTQPTQSVVNLARVACAAGTDHVFWIGQQPPPGGPSIIGGARWDGTVSPDVLIEDIGTSPNKLTADGDWVYLTPNGLDVRGYDWKDTSKTVHWYTLGTLEALKAKEGALYWSLAGDSYIYRAVR